LALLILGMFCPPSPPSLGEMLESPPELGDLGGDKNYCDSFFHTLIKQRRLFNLIPKVSYFLTIGLFLGFFIDLTYIVDRFF
jgi:hypothetical protein